jgi:hypothetical protein
MLTSTFCTTTLWPHSSEIICTLFGTPHMAFEGDAWEAYAATTHNFSKLMLENLMYDTIVTRAIMLMCFWLQLWPALHHEVIVVLEPSPCCNSCACIITSLKSGYVLLQCSFYKMFIFCFASCWLKLVSNLVFNFHWIFLNLILLL